MSLQSAQSPLRGQHLRSRAPGTAFRSHARAGPALLRRNGRKREGPATARRPHGPQRRRRSVSFRAGKCQRGLRGRRDIPPPPREPAGPGPGDGAWSSPRAAAGVSWSHGHVTSDGARSWGSHEPPPYVMASASGRLLSGRGSRQEGTRPTRVCPGGGATPHRTAVRPQGGTRHPLRAGAASRTQGASPCTGDPVPQVRDRGLPSAFVRRTGGRRPRRDGHFQLGAPRDADAGSSRPQCPGQAALPTDHGRRGAAPAWAGATAPSR